MKITQALLDNLTAQAKASPRLRMNYDLRNSPEDKSQRMLNAIEPGSPLPVHRHRHSSETVVILRGRLVEEFYDDLGRICEEAIELKPGGPVVALNIPIGQWHTVRALESGTVIIEVKDGPYEPRASFDYCVPSIATSTEYIEVTDVEGKQNHIILMTIPQSMRVHANQADEDFMVTLWRKEGSGTVQNDPESLPNSKESARSWQGVRRGLLCT